MPEESTFYPLEDSTGSLPTKPFPTTELDDSEDDGDPNTPTFRLTIHHDDSMGDDPPGSEDDFWTFHSFNDRHNSFTHPDKVLACQICGEGRDEFQHPEVEQTNDGDWKYADWARDYREENPEDLHAYKGPEGFMLSYFEHGNCRWGLAGSMSGTPDFQWDGVGIAGFLEIHPEVGGIDGSREWYDAMTQDEKEANAAAFLEDYTNWCNGEVYGYVLERLDPRTCDLGFIHEEEPLEEDSCWGFIGFDYFQEEVQRATTDMGATEGNTEVVDKAYDVSEYGTFFKVEEKEPTNA